MSRIRAQDTKPEVAVRKLLYSMGFRFRLHRKDLPGSPDIVLPKFQTAVFVHGCYWHRHPGCRYAYTPKSRVEFWTLKFEQNVVRDRKAISALSASGWRVIVVWECETRNLDKLRARLKLEID